MTRSEQRGFSDIALMALVAIIGAGTTCLPHHRTATPEIRPHPLVAAPLAAVERELHLVSAREGLPYRLVRAVAVNESALVSTAVSSAGAVGVMQLEPEAASDCRIRNRYDVHANVVCGVRLLRSLLGRYAWDVRRAIAAYNLGPAAVDRAHPHHAEPVETKRYVEAVMATYTQVRS